MIQNDAEYRQATQRLREEKSRLDQQQAKLEEMGLSGDEIKRAMDPMRSFHAQLEEEVAGYERLNHCEFDELQDLRGMMSSVAWDISFCFPFDHMLRGMRSVLTYRSFGKWYDLTDKENRVPVQVDSLNFDDLHDTGISLYASVALEDRKKLYVCAIGSEEYFDHVKGVPPIDKSVCQGGEISVSVFRISEPDRAILERVQEHFIDLSRSTIAQAPVERIHWGVEINYISDDEVTPELLMSKYVGTILPATHPLAGSIRGEQLTEGYTLYNWDIDELLR